jgi:tRNA pseudouridine synthase 10
MYPESVEEIVGNPTLEMTQGEDIAFHGAGREDIDARMLGLGRPFVIEVKKPRKRFINLHSLEKRINERAVGKVEVSNLRFANKEVVRRLKRGEEAQKLYRAIVELDKPVSSKHLALLQKSLTGTDIRQQTPRRVMHRRADLIREKHIYEAKVKRLKPNRIEMRIRCQGGLYIKELITGDEGRTVPSVAEILNTRAVPLELDVLGVFVEEEA